MKFVVNQSADGQICKLIGHIDESFASVIDELSEVVGNGPVTFDFEKVVAANSIGISHWLEFRRRNPDLKMKFTNCHESILDTATLIQSFFPPHSVATAHFHVTCSQCDRNEDFIFTPSADTPYPVAFQCSKCSGEIEYEDGEEFAVLFVET